MTLLSELKPKAYKHIIDLVDQAGVDISDWSNYKKGKTNPGANPKYCYEWAFIEKNKFVVLNLWYESMNEVDGNIQQQLNLRDPASIKLDNGVRKARRKRMEAAIAYAYQEKLPVRVIILDGIRREGKPAGKPANVKARSLDEVPWAVASYNDKTGVAVIRRGMKPMKYADQFSPPVSLEVPTAKKV